MLCSSTASVVSYITSMSGIRMLCSDALHWACSVVMRYSGYSALRIYATARGEVTPTSLQRTIIPVLEKSRLSFGRLILFSGAVPDQCDSKAI